MTWPRRGGDRGWHSKCIALSFCGFGKGKKRTRGSDGSMGIWQFVDSVATKKYIIVTLEGGIKL